MIRLRLEEVAKAKGISMTRLSRISDVEYRTVRKIFRNPEAEIGMTTLDKLCWALHATPAELIEYKRTPPESLRDIYSDDDSEHTEK
jgi:DNA-binding Xre family transcriptional regulator